MNCHNDVGTRSIIFDGSNRLQIFWHYLDLGRVYEWVGFGGLFRFEADFDSFWVAVSSSVNPRKQSDCFVGILGLFNGSKVGLRDTQKREKKIGFRMTMTLKQDFSAVDMK